jgi:hypothetical protein
MLDRPPGLLQGAAGALTVAFTGFMLTDPAWPRFWSEARRGVLSLSLPTHPLTLWPRPARRHHDMMISFVLICRNPRSLVWRHPSGDARHRPQGLLQGAAGVLTGRIWACAYRPRVAWPLERGRAGCAKPMPVHLPVEATAVLCQEASRCDPVFICRYL